MSVPTFVTAVLVALLVSIAGIDALENPTVLQRQRRDAATDLLDTAGSLGLGGSYMKKFQTLLQGTPPNVKEAFIKQDFSNVSASDIKRLNITVLEFIPTKFLSKLNLTLLNPIVEKLLHGNRPMALGRVMNAIGDKMDSNQLLDKIRQDGGLHDRNEEGASVLLYTALSKVGQKGGIDSRMVDRLAGEGLLKLVPEEQLMKVKDSSAAKKLLDRLYPKQRFGPQQEDDYESDDKALVATLAQTAFGSAKKWTGDTFNHVGQEVISMLPASFLRNLDPNVVSRSIDGLKETNFESALQAKSVTDVYLESAGISNNGTVDDDKQGVLGPLVGRLGSLAAFVNPSLTKDTSILNTIVQACGQMNLPAPLKAITSVLKQHTHGRKVEDLSYEDIRRMGVAVIKNGPPSLIDKAVETNALSEYELQEIGGGNTRAQVGTQNGFGSILTNPFLKGIISQVASYAVNYFTRGNRINLTGLPAAFLGALGIRGIESMSNRDLDDVIAKLKDDPDSLDDAQKALLLKRLKDSGMIDSADLPPEIRNLQPRKKGENIGSDILDGLPSDAELRLAFGESRQEITAADLERDDKLVGTLMPKQVEMFDLEEIPQVLAIVRKSKDGPQPQTLKALAKRFGDYIRAKSEDYESEDKKLLKHITASQVGKLPATVLAYFIDHKQTSKLPADVRKEIMTAMGELSAKDHATIPGKTREEIIMQGLAALDELTGDESKKKLDAPELAVLGSGVADLPADRIEKLSPVALEQSLDIIQGTVEDTGLKQRACLKPAQKSAWRNRIVKQYGQPSNWDAATVSTLCCSLALLSESDMKSIQPDALATCRCPSDEKPPSHLDEQKKALDASCKFELDGAVDDTKKKFTELKADIGFDLDDLESQIISSRKKRAASEQLTCFKVRLTGTALPYSQEQLESLPAKDLDQCIYELGLDQLPQEHERVLWKKFVKAKRGVMNLNGKNVRYAGYVLSGVTLSDVKELNMGDADIVAAFGKPLGLSKNVLEKLASQLLDKKRKPLARFDSGELAVANNILCGFAPDALQEINPYALRDALPTLRNLDKNCEQTRVAALATVAMKREVLGDPSQWTAADVRGMGILLNGVPIASIEKIPAEAFLGISPSTAASLSETVLSSLTADQMGFMPRFSAQSLTDSQLSVLSEEARESVNQLMVGPTPNSANKLVHSTTSTCSLVLFAVFSVIFSRQVVY